MVKVKVVSSGKTFEYDYPDKSRIRYLVDKELNDKFNKICDEHKISKGKLFEAVMKSIVLRYRDNSLNQTSGYFTINISEAKKT